MRPGVVPKVRAGTEVIGLARRQRRHAERLARAERIWGACWTMALKEDPLDPSLCPLASLPVSAPLMSLAGRTDKRTDFTYYGSVRHLVRLESVRVRRSAAHGAISPCGCRPIGPPVKV